MRRAQTQLCLSVWDHSTESDGRAYPDCAMTESTAPVARQSVAQGAGVTTHDVLIGIPSLFARPEGQARCGRRRRRSAPAARTK
jgi:hypothetical protein